MPSLRAKALAPLIIAPGLFCGIHHPLVPKIPRSLWSRGVLCELELAAILSDVRSSHIYGRERNANLTQSFTGLK